MRPLLEATTSLIVGTSIVNIWAYEPGELAAEHAALTRDFPDRLLVGIGVGHPEATSDYTKPFTAIREFLDGLDAAPDPIPRDRRCIAALAPKSLALSGERTLGTIPYFTPVAHTRAAREQLGTGALVAPELAFALDDDRERARETARTYAAYYLARQNYTNNLLRFGYSEADIVDSGSDRLLDEVVPHGIARRDHRHRTRPLRGRRRPPGAAATGRARDPARRLDGPGRGPGGVASPPCRSR